MDNFFKKTLVLVKSFLIFPMNFSNNLICIATYKEILSEYTLQKWGSSYLQTYLPMSFTIIVICIPLRTFLSM